MPRSQAGLLLFLALLTILAGSCRPTTAPRASRHPLTINAPNAFEVAFQTLGLSPERLHHDPPFMASLQSSRGLLPAFDWYRYRPLEIPYILGHVREGILHKPDETHQIVQSMLTKTGDRVRSALREPHPIDNWQEKLEKSDAPLWEVMGYIWQTREVMPDGNEQGRLFLAQSRLPRRVQEATALLLLAVAEADSKVSLAFRPLENFPEGPAVKDWFTLWESHDGKVRQDLENRVAAPSLMDLYGGGQELALALDRAREKGMDRPTTESFAFSWHSPLGQVWLGSRTEETAPTTGPCLLTIHWDDSPTTHLSGAAATWPEQKVSLLVDLGGDDAYVADPEGFGDFAAARGGIALLYDAGGNDVYRAGSVSLGAACQGMALLIDERGEDHYDGDNLSQGAGWFGLGLLLDREGRDQYRAFTQAQGFGGTRGCGYLLDRGTEGDHYLLRNDELRYPAPQAPKTHNTSLGQGFGYGRRADLQDGRSWAGGYGLLMDEGGDDTYEAAVFAQGGAYWYGMGFLLDREGNDLYDAHYYVQGAAAHFGIAMLWDHAGNDHYRATAQVAQGGAHDWSVAWCLDESGNDLYETGNLSLGAANANGMGFLLDGSGDDTYRLQNANQTFSIGAARHTKWGSLRESHWNLGLFLDLAGQDKYEKFPLQNNAMRLGQEDHPDLGLKGQRSLALDGEYPFPLRLEPWTEKPVD